MAIPRQLIDALYPQLPRAVQQAILVRIRSKLWIKRGIVFIHIPKAAGTSINQALFGRFMGHPRARDIERWGSAALRAVPRISVTRNPWDRLLSAYRFAVRGPTPEGSVAAIWNPRQYRIAEFESFERFVMEWLPRRDINRLDFVFQPQRAFVCDRAGRVIVDHLGRLEDLAPTRVVIEKLLGGPVDIPWTNTSGDRLDYRTMYTPAMAAVAGEIYREDIAAFGYDF